MNKLKRILIAEYVEYTLYNIGMLALAYLFGRFFQMLLFILFYSIIQNCFRYRFHADTLFPNDPIKAVKYCKLITFVVEIIYMIFCKELNVSVYSNLFIIFIIALISSLLQTYYEQHSNIHNKEHLLSRGREVGLSKTSIQRLIYRYVDNMSLQEIADKECLEIESIKQSLRRSKLKLGL